MQASKIQRLKVKRKAIKIVGDTSRVITRLHLPDERSRIKKIIQRIVNLPNSAAEALMAQIMVDFAGRHEDIGTVFGAAPECVAGLSSTGYRTQRSSKITHRRFLYQGVLH